MNPNDDNLCWYCGAPVQLLGSKTCSAAACLRQRSTELARNYRQANRALINEQRKSRYHRHQQTHLTMSQGRAIRALWQEGHLIQRSCIIYSPTTQQRVCQLSVIECLANKGYALFTEERWIPLIQEDEFFSSGCTISDKPKPQYIRTLNPAQAGLLRALYANPRVMIVNGSVAATDEQGQIKHIGCIFPRMAIAQ